LTKELDFCISNNAMPFIDSLAQPKIILKSNYFEHFKTIFIKVNIDMHRLGMSYIYLQKTIQKLVKKDVEIVIVSHLSSAESTAKENTQA